MNLKSVMIQGFCKDGKYTSQEPSKTQRCTVNRYRRHGKRLFTVTGNFENFTGKTAGKQLGTI